MIHGDMSRSPGHDPERHCRPREMNRPAVGHGQLDDQGHEEQSECGKAGAKSKDQQDREEDFPRSGKEGHHRRRRKMVWAARQVQHELICEQGHCSIAESAEAIPFEDAGAPERHRQRDARHQLNEGRERNRLHQTTGPVDQLAYGPKSLDSIDLLISDHRASPEIIFVKAPASIMPAIFAAMSKEDKTSSAEPAASPSDRPDIRLSMNVAPPGGSPRRTTSRSGRVINASSGVEASILQMGLLLRFVATIVTAVKRERTIRVAGCALKARSASFSSGTSARAAGGSGSASAAW